MRVNVCVCVNVRVCVCVCACVCVCVCTVANKPSSSWEGRKKESFSTERWGQLHAGRNLQTGSYLSL